MISAMTSPNLTAKLTSQANTSSTRFTVPEDCLVFDTDSGGFIPWDNPDNILSQDVEQLVALTVDMLALCLFFISVPCNILNMIVFWKHGVRERINLCLFYLSLVDFLHMVISFFFNVDRLYLPLHGAGGIGPVMQFILDHHLMGLHSFGWLSGFISMVIACERCLCVVSPLRSQTVLKTRTTAVILLVPSLPLVAGVMLVGLERGLVCVYDLDTHVTYQTVYTSRVYTQHKVILDLIGLVLGLFQTFIYVSVVMVTTVITSVKLKKMADWRQKTSSSTLSSREVALTRTLIAISVLFLVCSLPIMVTGTMSMFVEEFSFERRYHNLGQTCVSFCELASYINATFNFFVYCSMGSKFRQTLRDLFQCRAAVSDSPGDAKRNWTETGGHH